MHKNKDFGILSFLHLLIKKFMKTSKIWKHSPSVVSMGVVVVHPLGWRRLGVGLLGTEAGLR